MRDSRNFVLFYSMSVKLDAIGLCLRLHRAQPPEGIKPSATRFVGLHVTYCTTGLHSQWRINDECLKTIVYFMTVEKAFCACVKVSGITDTPIHWVFKTATYIMEH